jgi:hypothetical protein
MTKKLENTCCPSCRIKQIEESPVKPFCCNESCPCHTKNDFSNFIRNASKEEKEKVISKAIKEAKEEYKKIMDTPVNKKKLGQHINWKKEFDSEFGIHFSKSELQFVHKFIEDKFKESYQEGMTDEAINCNNHCNTAVDEYKQSLRESVEKLYKNERPLDVITGEPVETYGYEETHNQALKEVLELLK